MIYLGNKTGALFLDPTDPILFSVVDGIAEVWPVDAPSHALLAGLLFGRQAGTLGIAIHFGAALAILVFLWRDIALIGKGLLRLRKLRIEPGLWLLAKALLVAAPVLTARAMLGGPAPLAAKDLLAVGAATIIAALAMGFADRLCMTVKRIEHLGIIDALVLGAAQLLDLVPGIGRLAAGLTVARLLGYERPAAYRFLLLADALVLFAAGGGEGLVEMAKGRPPAVTDLLVGSAGFAVTLAALAAGLSWVRQAGLLPFAVYRLILGAAMIALTLI